MKDKNLAEMSLDLDRFLFLTCQMRLCSLDTSRDLLRALSPQTLELRRRASTCQISYCGCCAKYQPLSTREI